MIVMTAEKIIQTTAHIFSNKRDKQGRSIEDKHRYNLETLRIRREGGDTFKRLLFLLYFGTTMQEWWEVSCRHGPTLVWMLSVCVRACNSMLT